MHRRETQEVQEPKTKEATLLEIHFFALLTKHFTICSLSQFQTWLAVSQNAHHRTVYAACPSQRKRAHLPAHRTAHLAAPAHKQTPTEPAAIRNKQNTSTCVDSQWLFFGHSFIKWPIWLQLKHFFQLLSFAFFALPAKSCAKDAYII